MIDLTFLMAGRAVFTVENNQDQHYTFKVSSPQDKPNTHFVKVMTGGAESYSYVGMMVDANHVVPTKASQFKHDSIAVKVFNFAVRIITGAQELPNGYDIHHEGICGACGRALTDPESIRTGFGPVCRNKLV